MRTAIKERGWIGDQKIPAEGTKVLLANYLQCDAARPENRASFWPKKLNNRGRVSQARDLPIYFPTNSFTKSSYRRGACPTTVSVSFNCSGVALSPIV
jgi:hypothetical protein